MMQRLSETKARKRPTMSLGSRATELQIAGDTFSEGDEVGVGICVNDGDTEAGQAGQKGWDGWYPHAVVYGKNSEKNRTCYPQQYSGNRC